MSRVQETSENKKALTQGGQRMSNKSANREIRKRKISLSKQGKGGREGTRMKNK